MLTFEKSLWNQGFTKIAGIDEVGRGCLFGDVVAAAVILPVGMIISGINDSKQLTPAKRDILYDYIIQNAVSYGVGVAGVEIIESINIKQASRLAMKQAVEQLSISPDVLLIDAEQIEMIIPQQAIIHGDQLSQSIAAASILAKVTRDRMCIDWELQYPGYEIAQHKGYATKKHRECIAKLGATPLHRKMFIRNILNETRKNMS